MAVLFLDFVDTSADGRAYKDFVRAEFGSGHKFHFFNKAVQLRTTVNGAVEASGAGTINRNRLRSGAGAYCSMP